MTTAAAIAELTEQEALAKLLAAGYRREKCTACEGVGHFTIVNDDARDWKRYKCETCGGAGVVWHRPNF